MYGHISQALGERDTLQRRVKINGLWQVYQKAKAGLVLHPPRAFFFFLKELDTILGGDPTSSHEENVDISHSTESETEVSPETEVLHEEREADEGVRLSLVTSSAPGSEDLFSVCEDSQQLYVEQEARQETQGQI